MKAPTSPCTIPTFILIAADRYPVALAAYLKRRLQNSQTASAPGQPSVAGIKDSVPPGAPHGAQTEP